MSTSKDEELLRTRGPKTLWYGEQYDGGMTKKKRVHKT